MYSVALSSL